MKVIKITEDFIEFSDGTKLSSEHENDCCENHFLSFSDLKLDDFEKLEFDLSSDSFFKRIEDYGIELIPIEGFPIRIPGYGYNNGYYSANLTLVISKEGVDRRFDIFECQKISE